MQVGLDVENMLCARISIQHDDDDDMSLGVSVDKQKAINNEHT
jgi:hypothetical protein